MSGAGPGPRGDDRRPSPGSIAPTSSRTLAGWAAAGLVGGWLLHPVSERVLGSPPLVTWAQPLALGVVAVVVGWTAWTTHRVLHQQRGRLENHQAVNRLVLARAAALVGALMAAGYLGYAISWIGDGAALADQRMWRSGLCAVLGLATTIGALLLERACRVRSDDSES